MKTSEKRATFIWIWCMKLVKVGTCEVTGYGSQNWQRAEPVAQLRYRLYSLPILCPTSVCEMYIACFHISAKTEPSFCHVRILHAAHKLMVISEKTDHVSKGPYDC